MGLMSFLSSLVNGDHPDAENDPNNPNAQAPQHQWGYDPDGYLMKGAAPPPAPAVHSPDDVVIQGDPWQPKKGTILGAIADAIAYHGNGTTPFHDERDKMNMESASKGLMDHPEEAIARIAKINPELAWKYRDQVADNNRMKDNLQRQNDVLGLQRDRYTDGIIGNMMNVAVQRNDPVVYQKMRAQAIALGNKYGSDYSARIPEQYDPDNAELLAMGVVPVAKQMQMQETKDYHGATTDYRNRNLQERTGYHQGVLALGGKNAGERESHNVVSEDQKQQTIDKTPSKPTRRAYDTKYGRGLVSPDGMQMNITPDPRVDQTKLHKNKNGEYRLIYDNLGTADKPIWRLRK